MKYNEEKIVEDYLKGKNTKEIADELGTYNTSIRRILLRNGVKVRTQSEAQAKTVNVFKDLELEQVQYWLGFLAADGTIAKKENLIALELQKKDLEHLKKYCAFVGISYKEIPYPKYNTVGYRAFFKNKEVKEYLMQLGITDNKSKTLEIKFEFNSHFIRGVFDGDGYVKLITENRAAYEIATMSEKFSLQLSTYLKLSGIQHNVTLRKDGIYIIGIYTQSEVDKFHYMIYNNATVFLERKKAVICPLYEEIQIDAKLSNSVNQA